VRRRLPLVVASMAMLMVPAGAAGAKVLRSESVLPPGESGFVSTPGLADGTGSAHLYDQLDPFIQFRRKSAMLGEPGVSESPRTGVRIVRDRFGVPAVYGANMDGAWWGAGYAMAQDRLFQLELFRRATTGRLAEILGESYLDTDIASRRDYYTPAELDGMLHRLPAGLQARFFALRDGINAWIQHATTHPADLPGEFAAVGDLPIRAWTVEDSLAIGVVLARTIPVGDGNELPNLAGLRELGPGPFAKLLPLRVPGQITTVPAANGAFPSDPGRTAAQERSAYARSQRFVTGLPIPTGPVSHPIGLGGSDSGSPGLAGLPLHLGGSYMFAVHRAADRRAYLFNGPELGFAAPEELYEIEVHAPGLAVRGVTAAGVPVVGIGHNADVAWGLTSGESDVNDLYAEQLVPGQPDRYRFRGAVRAMSCRPETFLYRGQPTAPTGGLGVDHETLCRTVHGPVQQRAGNVAYARRYATFDREIQTLQGLADLNQARDIRGVDHAVSEVTWNENLMAVDGRGHIGYWHPGLLPVRPVGWDERLPYPGTGEAEWRGFLPVGRRPHVIDPKQGWLANWNNVPSTGFTSGDAPALGRLDGPFHRVGWLDRLLARLARRPTYDGVRAVVQRAGTVAQQRPLDASRLAAAVRGAGPPEGRAVLRTILAWDGSYARTASDGTVDPGVATFEAFKLAAQDLALRKLGGGRTPGSATLVLAGQVSPEHMFDALNGVAYALRTLSPAGYRRAAANAFGVLAKRFGSPDPARWREPRRLYPIASQGAESPGKLPFFDRGTWEQVAELTAVPARAAHPAPHAPRPHRPRFTG